MQGSWPYRNDGIRLTRSSLARALENNGDLQEALKLVEEEIRAEDSIIHDVDEFPSEYNRRFLRDWRYRLAAQIDRSDRHQDGKAGEATA
ncbi:hypothetical protein ACIP4Y_37335 [Streptomyces sp. NPDC088810]|uniref:hypothetical protein n=1 Tax=Streptomyces sp. NPDC088810 TaxID=3365904 RepID=UPI003820891F